MKTVSVIIINYNTESMTERTIRRLLDSETDIKWQIILLDNNSSEKISVDKFEKLGCTVILNNKNLGFAKAVNVGLESAQGDFVLLLNSDVLLENGAVSRLIGALSGSAVIVGPQMVYPDGRFQSSFGPFPSLYTELLRFSLLYKIFPGGTFAVNTFFKKIDFSKTYPVDWVSGGCMLIDRKILEKLPRFDANYFLGGEDIDYCYLAKRAGFGTIYCPQVKVIHYHGYSSGHKGTLSKKRIAYDRDGLDYFFKKNFPKKKLTQYFIKNLHNLKIRLLTD